MAPTTRGAKKAAAAAAEEAPVKCLALDVLNGDLLTAFVRWIREGRDLAVAGAVCREWRAAADVPQLWRILCIARWPSCAEVLPANSNAWRTLYIQRSRPQRRPRPRTTLESCKLLIEVPGLLSRALPLSAFDQNGYHPGACLNWLE